MSKGQKLLLVIDGKVTYYNNLQDINHSYITSVDVLKDSNSTAIYGSKGSNGAILISTKNSNIQPSVEPLYMVDGMPIKKENNHLIANLSESEIDSWKVYGNNEAKKKFGRIAKNGCIVLTTLHGNFRFKNNESYAIIEENNFEKTNLSPLSTFSIDVDRASYSNIRRMINNGMIIEPDAVKIEEMINYFDYDYPQPTDEHPFSINTEVARTPWHKDTKLEKIELQGKTYSNEELPPSNLTFL